MRHRSNTLSKSTAPPGAWLDKPLQPISTPTIASPPISEDGSVVSEIVMDPSAPTNPESFSDLPTLPINGNLFADPLSTTPLPQSIEFSDTSSTNPSPALSELPQISASSNLPPFHEVSAITAADPAHSSASSLSPYSFPDPPDPSSDSAQASVASLYEVPHQPTPNPPLSTFSSFAAYSNSVSLENAYNTRTTYGKSFYSICGRTPSTPFTEPNHHTTLTHNPSTAQACVSLSSGADLSEVYPPVIEVSSPDGANHYYLPTPEITSPSLHDSSTNPMIVVSGPDEANNYHHHTTDQTSFDQLDLPETYTTSDEDANHHIAPSGIATQPSCIWTFGCCICILIGWICSKSSSG